MIGTSVRSYGQWGRWWRLAWPALLMLAVAACSDPLNYQVSRLSRGQQADLRAVLTADQARLLDDWVVRQTQGGKALPDGVTVYAALQDQSNWRAEQKAATEKAAALADQQHTRYAARQRELAGLISARFVSKANKVLPDDRKFVSLRISYENKSGRSVRSIKGLLKLVDVYGEPVMDVDCIFTKTISPGATVIDADAGVFVRDEDEVQMSLWSTDFSKMAFTFDILEIEFADGTKVTDAIS